MGNVGKGSFLPKPQSSDNMIMKKRTRSGTTLSYPDFSANVTLITQLFTSVQRGLVEHNIYRSVVLLIEFPVPLPISENKNGRKGKGREGVTLALISKEHS